jgi:cytochrome b subunit of formate dehydrogenase
MSGERTFTRFTKSQRVQHWTMVAGFLGLTVTGIPQKYADRAWGELSIGPSGASSWCAWATGCSRSC